MNNVHVNFHQLSFKGQETTVKNLQFRAYVSVLLIDLVQYPWSKQWISHKHALKIRRQATQGCVVIHQYMKGLEPL